ncbi:MAG: hypothetical protein SFU86_21345 [Pirellulaceae bacterium]|nr:hypothetical protein [Pirellulaceae bacterium]
MGTLLGRSWRWLGAFMAMTLVASSPALAITTEDFKNSVWNTSYTTSGGGRVAAKVTFAGDSGSYAINGGEGELSNITYRFTEQGGKFTVTVNARWTLGDKSGTVQWQSSNYQDPPQLNGDWYLGGARGGRWTGEFAGTTNQPVNPQGNNQPDNNQAGGNVEYGDWAYNGAKGYYYRRCSFPAGGHQYVIYYPNRTQWVYWYNPEREVIWCACPTVNHPTWGDDIRAGKDLFLMATVKGRNADDCEFPNPGDGDKFVTGQATDKDGSKVNLGCPPPDLP